jgi:S-adenosylmethionine hydrolase
LLKPVIESNTIKGIITYIDDYGNAITNIDIKTFENIRRSRKFSVLFGREDEEIKTISTKYKEVEVAEKLAIFNSNNYLQISINQGNANNLLGLKFYDIIRIEFK